MRGQQGGVYSLAGTSVETGIVCLLGRRRSAGVHNKRAVMTHQHTQWASIVTEENPHGQRAGTAYSEPCYVNEYILHILHRISVVGRS